MGLQTKTYEAYQLAFSYISLMSNDAHDSSLLAQLGNGSFLVLGRFYSALCSAKTVAPCAAETSHLTSTVAVRFMTTYHIIVTSKKWRKRYWSEWEMRDFPSSIC